MLTEEKLPLLIKGIDVESGLVEVVYRTVIKRDDEVIHTIYDHQTADISSMTSELDVISKAADESVKAHKASLAEANIV